MSNSFWKRFSTINGAGLRNVFKREFLLYRGDRSYYIIGHGSKVGSPGYFHLKHKLCPINSSSAEILKAFYPAESIDFDEHGKYTIRSIDVPIDHIYGKIQRLSRGFSTIHTGYMTAQEGQELISMYSQLNAYMYRLAEVARVVHIADSNLNIYGQEIRNLLILVCTEVELLFKRLIWPNNPDRHGNMEKYFLSNQFSKLSDYEVRLRSYGEIPTLKPFHQWQGQPTYTPLEWYQSYNATKHNRRFGSDGANLGNLLNAIAACSILLDVQTGYFLSDEKKHPAMINYENEFIVKKPVWDRGDYYTHIPNRRLKHMPIPGLS